MNNKFDFFKPIDIYESFKHLFSDKAIADTQRRKSYGMVLQYEEQIEKIGIRAFDPYDFYSDYFKLTKYNNIDLESHEGGLPLTLDKIRRTYAIRKS